jgi:hypothetical protein
MILQEISSIRENMDEFPPEPSHSMLGLVAVQDYLYEIEPPMGLGMPEPVEAGVAVVASRKDAYRLPDNGAVIVADYPNVGEFLEAVKQLQRNQLKLDGELGSIIDQRVDEIDATDMIIDEMGEIVSLGDMYRAWHDEEAQLKRDVELEKQIPPDPTGEAGEGFYDSDFYDPESGSMMESTSIEVDAVIEIPHHRDMDKARIALNQWGIAHRVGRGIIEVSRRDLGDAREALFSARVRYRR